MSLDQPVPREVKAVDTASLIRLEAISLKLGLSQRLPSAWMTEHAAHDGRHYLWPAIWHELMHRPDVPRHIRCELLLQLRTGDQVMSLLDVLPADFDPLERVTSRYEGLRVRSLLDSVLSVREWDLLRDDGASDVE